MSTPEQTKFSATREKIHEIIFEADTPMGRLFDIALLVFIVASVLVVMVESIPSYQERFTNFFLVIEWIFTIFFTIEYCLRLYCVYKPMKYATSFFGIIDLLSILPAYVSLFIAGTQSLMVIRALRLLRIFRIFKLAKFLNQSKVITTALKESRVKITVFLVFILLMVTIIGSVMYLVESSSNSSFTSIPRSIYWAIVTLTTVGYGDIAPITPLGQFLAAFVMIMGYAVIAVPTGIVSAELVKQDNKKGEEFTTRTCRHCSREGHDYDATNCKYCGEELHEETK